MVVLYTVSKLVTEGLGRKQDEWPVW
jgi:hypothetical protein